MGSNANTLAAAIVTKQGTPPYPPKFDTHLHKGHLLPIVEAVMANCFVRPALTVNAEAANVITVDIQLKDVDGANVAKAVELECALYDVNGLEALVGAFRLAETGAGSEVSTTAKPRLIITTDANGAAQLSVTDVAGGSGATNYLICTPQNLTDRAGIPARATVTFD